jgi:hypothetical protein
MPPVNEVMSELRAIHLPSDAGIGVGEIVLAVAIGLAAALVVSQLWAAIMNKGRRSLRGLALASLAVSKKLGPDDRLVFQAKLLRRLVRALRGEAAARQQGDAWLGLLDNTFRTDFFTRREGRCYGDGLYRPTPPPSIEVLDDQLRGLVKRMRR